MNSSVLVTGASRGIGRATALRLAKDGYDIVVHYHRNTSMAQQVAEEIQALGKKARLLAFDIADRSAVQEILRADIENHGAYYGVVLNAGIVEDDTFVALEDKTWDSVLSTNLDGFYNVLRPLVLAMVQRRKPGRIVSIASISGLHGQRGQTPYAAAKGGIIAASKSLALELATRKITVNCICPGLIDTDMLPETVRTEEIINTIPMRRLGYSEEVAGLVAYLFRDEAAYITRQVISVNGGLI